MSSMQPGPAAAPGAARAAEAVQSGPAGDGLDELAGRPLTEHADVFARLHAELQAALADIDHS